mgnify:CR=1 FL=1
MGAVVDQVRRLADNGYAEVVLTGVDITSYGADGEAGGEGNNADINSWESGK